MAVAQGAQAFAAASDQTACGNWARSRDELGRGIPIPLFSGAQPTWRDLLLALITARERVDPLHELSETLGSHYQRKQAFYAFEPPKTYDRDLYRLFSANPRHRRAQPASVFIRRHRAHVRKLVARWTGENQLTLDAVLDDMIIRCRAHNLRAVGSERKLLTDFTVLLTAKTMHALFGPSRRKWIAL